MIRVENAASKIYVGNLGDYGDKAELERAFSKYGEVISVWERVTIFLIRFSNNSPYVKKILRSNSKVARRPTGFAFVEMKEEDDAEGSSRVSFMTLNNLHFRSTFIRRSQIS